MAEKQGKLTENNERWQKTGKDTVYAIVTISFECYSIHNAINYGDKRKKEYYVWFWWETIASR